jgi:hypothetical protein
MRREITEYVATSRLTLVSTPQIILRWCWLTLFESFPVSAFQTFLDSAGWASDLSRYLTSRLAEGLPCVNCMYSPFSK